MFIIKFRYHIYTNWANIKPHNLANTWIPKYFTWVGLEAFLWQQDWFIFFCRNKLHIIAVVVVLHSKLINQQPAKKVSHNLHWQKISKILPPFLFSFIYVAWEKLSASLISSYIVGTSKSWKSIYICSFSLSLLCWLAAWVFVPIFCAIIHGTRVPK